MNFNFNVAQSNNNINYLKPYKIYNNVTLTDIETKEGTSAQGTPWKAMQLTFSCEEGIYNHSIFYIDSDADNRPTVDMPNGGKRELPSKWERTRDLMAAIGYAFFPEGFEKFQAVAPKAKTFEEIATVYIKVVKANLGKVATGMKLVGRNNNGKIYATLPNCTYSKEATDERLAALNNVEVGQWFTRMISPFGDNLSFTNYEETQKKQYENAAPTPMKEDPFNTPSESDDTEIDFDSLEL